MTDAGIFLGKAGKTDVHILPSMMNRHGLIAGATAVQIGTATFINPTAMVTIIDDLRAYLESERIKSVREIIGTVIDGEQKAGVVFMEAAP